MRKYEIMFIVRPDMEEAEITKTAENLKKVLTDQNSKMLEEKAMGPRELAYEIKKNKEGYYVVYDFEANPSLIAELERNYRITDEIIKFIVVKK